MRSKSPASERVARGVETTKHAAKKRAAMCRALFCFRLETAGARLAADLDRPDAPAVSRVHATAHDVAAGFVGVVVVVIRIAVAVITIAQTGAQSKGADAKATMEAAAMKASATKVTATATEVTTASTSVTKGEG